MNYMKHCRAAVATAVSACNGCKGLHMYLSLITQCGLCRLMCWLAFRPQQQRMQWIKAHFNRLWRNEGQCRQEYGVLKMGSYTDPYALD